MRILFIILFIIGVAVFLFCFIQWCFALANISSKNDSKEIERILYWNLWIAFSALYINIINILFKLCV
jgi:hypothetical protein